MPTIAELEAKLAEMQQKLDAAEKRSSLEFRVSPKGAVSVYGLGRFPVTLYGSQWSRLLDNIDALRAFIEANADKLTTK